MRVNQLALVITIVMALLNTMTSFCHIGVSSLMHCHS